jgi:NAD(P)-dependent dehydrogenase (short-subunit alcohol dehydrogenase family)
MCWLISVPGGSSGIGYAAAKILSSRKCKVHILDLNPPEDINYTSDTRLNFIKSDITDWPCLRDHFDTVGHVDFAFANAGVSEEVDYFADAFDAEGKLEEPTYNVLDVNVRATMNFVKLSLSAMRTSGKGGSIVITTSATAYAAEQSLPVYAAGKLAVSSLI